MATRTSRRRTSAARAQVPDVEETQLSEEELREQMEALKDKLDEGSPIHVDDSETEENFMEPVSGEFPGTAPSESQPESPPETQSSAADSIDSMSLAQKYTVWSVLTFGDCVQAKSPEDIFDTLARNFDNNGLLSFWLGKIGLGSLTVHEKRKDLIDYIRKVSHELFKFIKNDIGRPVARW